VANLQQVLRAEEQHLCDLGLEYVKQHAPGEYLKERPYPDVNEFLFRPTSDHGFQIYIEYFFFQTPTESSPDSDFWWVIINCAYAIPPFPSGKRDYYVIGLGWYVA
jgi:hypothetical protein